MVRKPVVDIIQNATRMGGFVRWTYRRRLDRLSPGKQQEVILLLAGHFRRLTDELETAAREVQEGLPWP